MTPSSSSCPLNFGGYVKNNFLRSEISPVSEQKKIVTKAGNLRITENFKDGLIKKAWDLDKNVVKDYVFLDKDILERIHPTITSYYGNENYPYGQLNDVKDVPESIWDIAPVSTLSLEDGRLVGKKIKGLKSQVLAAENGGWVIDAGLRTRGRKKEDPCSGGRSSARKMEACRIITSLMNLQEGEGYGLTPGTESVVKKKDGTVVASMNMSNVEDRLDEIGISPDSMTTYLNLLVSGMWYWYNTDDKNLLEKAVVKLAKEARSASEGKGSMIKDKDDLDRWASNIFKQGRGVAFLEMPFFPDPDVINTPVKKGPKFLKDDFLDNDRYSFKDCALPETIGLFDENGNYVPFKKKTIKGVIGSKTPLELEKWSWGCVSSKDFGDAGYIPAKAGELKRSLEKDKLSDGTFATTAKSIEDAIEDSAIGFWNTMVESEIGGKSDLTIDDLDALPVKIMNRLESTTRVEDVNIIKKVFSSMPREAIVTANGDVIPSPYLIPRKGRKNKGLSGPLQRLAKKGIVVGIETSYDRLLDDCT